MSAYKLEFIGVELTTWGGIALLKNLMDITGFEQLIETLSLPPTTGSQSGDIH